VKLIVGLGNPGAKYRHTRHNVGFAALDELAGRYGVDFESAPADAMIAKVRPAVLAGRGAATGQVDGVMLAKPLTFMNLSGHAVGDLLRYFKIALGDLFVVYDDVNLPLARLRARPRGSDGGHNGLKSVIAQLGTQEFARLRIGVGRGRGERDLADHVLSRFEPDEQGDIAAAIERAADAAEVFVSDGIEQVMNRFNGPDEVAGSE
jgi:PTH1 family peptidyl-tRNA hydrolase